MAVVFALVAAALITPGHKLARLPTPLPKPQLRVDRSAFVRAALGLAVGAAVSSPGRADAEQVASITTSGILFKDTLNIEGFEDPKVAGVKLYIADFQRPINERLASNFFSDPTQASVTCAKSGPITLADDINTSAEGEEVFSQARSLFFKTIKVRRIYDKPNNVLIYVSYSSRLNKGDDDNRSRFKSTMCALPIG